MSDTNKAPTRRQRPMSPHLGHYKLPITALASITHRLTGVFLTLSSLFFVYWLIVLSKGTDAYVSFEFVRDNIFVQLTVIICAGALFYHILNGIRHIIWDFGFGFDLSTATKASWLIVTLATLATAIFALKLIGII